MIYLSGRVQAHKIGKRPDIGIMLGFREGRLSHGVGHLDRTLWAADNGCFTNRKLGRFAGTRLIASSSGAQPSGSFQGTFFPYAARRLVKGSGSTWGA